MTDLTKREYMSLELAKVMLSHCEMSFDEIERHSTALAHEIIKRSKNYERGDK